MACSPISSFVGETFALHLSITDASGRTIDPSTLGSITTQPTWTESSGGVVGTLSATTGISVNFSSKSPGTTTITVTGTIGSVTLTNTVTVTVSAIILNIGR